MAAKEGDCAEPEAFYDRLAAVYDVLSDWAARLRAEAPFWRDLFDRHGIRSVLDAACGTGGHVLAFARRGLNAVGADLSPAMIRVAREKAAAEGVKARFVRVAFDELPDHFGLEFDAVLGLGNSLPHLLTEADLAAAFAGMAGVLRPDGVLVVQNDYDRRCLERARFFPVRWGTVAGEEVLVWRFADYWDDGAPTVVFHTPVFRRRPGGDWSVQVHSTLQRPQFAESLAAQIAGEGFALEARYGGFDRAPFDPRRSADLVLVARREA